jgi:cyclopropane fatty-acyl-phospholipid synthase-like methyltransferase
MPQSSQSHTSAVARQYDLFQGSLESLRKERKYLNYGYTDSFFQSYEQRQERLCLEVFAAAEIGEQHRIVDVGFGSGEQDFLLARTHPFKDLTGFNISERQVQYANRRADDEHLGHKLSFRFGEAEALTDVPNDSVDRLLAIECAFYFDRPRFYRRAAEVLKPGGRAIIADICFADSPPALLRGPEDPQRFGTRSGNRALWEKHFVTKSVRDIRQWTRPGAQLTVFKILQIVPFSSFGAAAVREWLKMAYNSQLVAWGLLTKLLCYDLIVLEKPKAS